MHKDQYGFTLIELMIVVSIIGVLVSIAAPSTAQFREKGFKAELMVFSGEYKKDVQHFFDVTGRLPQNNAEAGMPQADHIQGNYVRRVEIKDGSIYIDADTPMVKGMTLQASIAHESIMWNMVWR